ncbi:MAG: hypothetical protein IJP68_05445 [Selenomonadaceae bacterium]|nr:hypothetical protein [Selenomonadaceae bacterium]
MNATDIIERLGLLDLDAVTAKEIARFIERKLDERDKIKGQIARDLRRIDDMAFLDPNAYDQLKAKYRKRWTNTKKLTILEDMRKHYCQRRSDSVERN